MTTPVAPLQFFDRATGAKADRPKFGLLDVATVVSPGDPHWQNGVEYEPPVLPGAEATEIECLDAPATTPRSPAFGIPTADAAAFRVWAGFSCKTVGLTMADVRARALAKLNVSEGPFAEAQIWSEIDGSIMRPETQTVSTGPVPIEQAIGLLERKLYTDYSAVGVLHMPRELAAVADKAGAIRVDGNVIRTKLGTPIVFGNYDGQIGPSAADDGQYWIAATGDLTVLRGSPDINTDEGATAWVDVHTNTVYGIAERPWAVLWDDFAAASLVEVP